MSGDSKKINRLKFIFITGIIFASFYNFANPSYADGPPTNISPTNGSIIDAVTTPGTYIIEPVNISVDKQFALSIYTQFDLNSTNSAIMVLPNTGGIQCQYYINKISTGANPFNIYGNIESRLGNAAGAIGGHLIFLSPNGINIGPNSTINTGALTLSTAGTFKLHDSLGNVTTIGNNINNVGIPNGLKDLYDSSNVITYEGIASSPLSIISNEGILKTDSSFHPNNSNIDIVAGTIINRGTIGIDGTSDPTKETNKINLITADTAVYNVGTNTYTLTEVPSGSSLGAISILKNSVVQGNDIKLTSKAQDVTDAPLILGSSGGPGYAINVDGLIQADELAGNSGKITLTSESSNINDFISIARTGLGGIDADAKITASGSNAEIKITANNLNIMDYKNDSGTIIDSGKNISMTISQFAATSGTSKLNAGGDITINTGIDVGGNSFSLEGQINSTGKTTITGAGTITISAGSNITSNATGNAIVVATTARSFINNAGGTAFLTPAGRWLVYSSNPASTTEGFLSTSYNKHYGITYGSDISSYNTGNYFFYRDIPTLTVTANDASKTYGSVNPALTYVVNSGLIDSDTAATALSGLLSTGATQFSDVSGGPYAINQGALSSPLGYAITFNDGIFTIDPKQLTASLTGTASKTYDTTLVAAIAAGNYSLPGIVGGDTVVLNNPTSGTYDDKNVGTGKLVSVSGLALTGIDAGNYSLASTSLSGNIGTILAKELTASLTGTASKTYDAILAAALASGNYSLPGVIGGDTVVLNNPTSGTYDDKNVGTGKLVSVSGLALTGIDAGNYSLASTSLSGNIGTILAKDITALLTGTASKTYDATLAADLSGNYSLNKIAGDTVSLSNIANGTYDTKNVGTLKTVSVSGLALTGADAGNYNLTTTSLSGNIGTILAKDITVTADNKSKLFGEVNPAFTASYNGFATGEDVSFLGGALVFNTSATTDSSIGNYSIIPSGLTNNNYTIAFINGTLTIKENTIPVNEVVKEVTGSNTINELVIANQPPDTNNASTAPVPANVTPLTDTQSYTNNPVTVEQPSVISLEDNQPSSSSETTTTNNTNSLSSASSSETNSNEVSVNSTSTNNESTVSSNKPEENKKDSKETKNNPEAKSDKNNDRSGLSTEITSEITKNGILNVDKSNYKNYYGDEFVNALEKKTNKQNELIADLNGVDYALKSGYNPAGMAGFLISIYFIENSENQLSGNKSVKMNSVFSYQHPKTITRLEQIKTQLNKLEENHQIAGITGKVQLDEIKKIIK